MKIVNQGGDEDQAIVSLRKTSLGNILVGAEGRTLYPSQPTRTPTPLATRGARNTGLL